MQQLALRGELAEYDIPGSRDIVETQLHHDVPVAAEAVIEELLAA